MQTRTLHTRTRTQRTLVAIAADAFAAAAVAVAPAAAQDVSQVSLRCAPFGSIMYSFGNAVQDMTGKNPPPCVDNAEGPGSTAVTVNMLARWRVDRGRRLHQPARLRLCRTGDRAVLRAGGPRHTRRHQGPVPRILWRDRHPDPR
jgi:hypothetical protein